MRIDDKELKKLMSSLGFVANGFTKHCIVFTDPVKQIRVRTSKTTSDKNRRLKNLKSELRRIGYEV